MPVTDDQVAALRAYLSDDMDRYRQLFAGLDREAARSGYATLLAAAFFEAVDRRFAEDGTTADVIEFVADVRTRSQALGEVIDPHAAERLIGAALTDEDIDDLDAKAKGRLFAVLLAGLIADEQLSKDGLDEFLAEARKLADEWLG